MPRFSPLREAATVAAFIVHDIRGLDFDQSIRPRGGFLKRHGSLELNNDQNRSPGFGTVILMQLSGIIAFCPLPF
ncbi:hypothetical protein EAS62_27250 [Bradyrhizobium zhanjiangense]|uniref:Uncharacterized protein n=1 Tax=Bradyrhizobium zhanjiangense TaxID=1325107 RepID=A0ABY0DEP0_9BRAD|nr:hypothetical protein EAS62_27250 [Bradyrhizobium zhanjiangense]